MEKAENDNLIGSLYTLRAGLSLVAQEKEAFECEVAKAKELKKEAIEKLNKMVKDKIDETEQEQKKLASLQREYEDCLFKARKGALKKRNKYIFGIVTLLSLWGLCVLTCIVCAIITFVLGDSLPIRINTIVAILIPVSGILAWGGGFLIFIKLIPDMKDELKQCLSKKEHKGAISRLPELLGEIILTNEIIEQKNNKLSKIKAEADKTKAKFDVIYANDCEKAKEHVMAAGEIIKALQETYSYLLDMRDWANLDLIIYSLETRRADSIKEALQIVDSEKRADRIAGAVKQASIEICRSLNTGLSSIRNEMNSKFNALSQQITSHTALLSGQMAELTNETNMNRALLEQANKSSTQLAHSVEQIRDSAKYIATHI